MLWPPPYEIPVTPIAVGHDDALVDEQAQQVLGVAGLPALVGEMYVGPRGRSALGRAERVLRRSARAAEAARGVVDDRVAAPCEEVVVVVEGGGAVGIAAAGRVARKEPLSPP